MDGGHPVPHRHRPDLDERRPEFILLSDTLGISMLVVALEQARGAKALADKPGEKPTEATVQGPFFWPGAPKRELGDDIGEGHGEPTLYHGRVTDTFGKPLANCELDVWSGDDEGFYDMQKGDQMQLRAQFRTDAEGNYRFWSIKPTFYPVPGDGPVGAMLDKMGRHLNRPGHMHMMLPGAGTRAAGHASVRQGQPLSRVRCGVRREEQPDRGVPQAFAGQGAGRAGDEPAVLHGEVRLPPGAVGVRGGEERGTPKGAGSDQGA